MKTTQQLKDDFFMATVNSESKKNKSKQFYIEQNKIKKLILDEKLDKKLTQHFFFKNEGILKREFSIYIQTLEDKETDTKRKEYYSVIKTLYKNVSPTLENVEQYQGHYTDTKLGWDFELFGHDQVKAFDVPENIVDAIKGLGLSQICSHYTEIRDDSEGYLHEDYIKKEIYNMLYGCIVPILDEDYINVIKKMNNLIKDTIKEDAKEEYNSKTHNTYILIINEFCSESLTLENIKNIFRNHGIHLFTIDELL